MKTTTVAAFGFSLAATAAALGGTTRAARTCPVGPTVMDGAKDAVPVVQLAILLDTSNSMDGLIDQARSQLWKVVNEFSARARDRERIQAEINELNRERSRHVAGLSGSQGPADVSLDAAMSQALRRQAACTAIELQ